MILISCLICVFIAAFGMTPFANGFWKSGGGILVSSIVLNKFWYCTFYWIDYQRFVFFGIMFNKLDGRAYD